MRNVNQRRNYSNFKYFNDVCATALHESTDKFLGDEGAVIRTGGELDFIKMDRKELANKQIDRNRMKLERYAKREEVEGLVARLLGRITDLKSPEEPKHPNG
jgi:hypothetical protein